MLIFAYGDAMHEWRGRWRRAALGAATAFAVLAGSPALAARIDPQVVNGRDPEPGEIRALVSVQGGSLSCGGTLVDALHVVTAAHCVVDSQGAALDPTRVRVGWSSTTSRPVPNLATIDVAVHPQYSPVTFANDIAVLTLATPIPGATPMLIANATRSATALAKGQPVKSAGFGYISVQGPASNRVLIADLVALPDRVCASRTVPYQVDGIDFYGFGSQIDIANAVCAIGVVPGTTSIIDTCQGDSGGPLYAGVGVSARLVGVVSVGDGCAGFRDNGEEMPRKRPGVYARTSSALDWLASEGVDMSDTSLAPPVITSATPHGLGIEVKATAGSTTRVDLITFTATPVSPSARPGTCASVVQSGGAACHIEGLASGETYEVTAVATAGDLESVPSSPVTVTIAGKPGTPRIREAYILGEGRVQFVVVPGSSADPATQTTVACVPRAPAKAAVDTVSGPVVDGEAVLRLEFGYRYTCRAITTNAMGSSRSRPVTVAI